MPNLWCQTCCNLPGLSRSNRFKHFFVADNFGRTCFEKWKVMFFQYLPVLPCRMQRSILVMVSIHVEKPSWRPHPIEAWHTWKVRSLCKQNELLVFVRLLEVLGQCPVIRLAAFAVSKDDHLLDPYAQANWKVSSSFCPCILCPRILSLCSSSEHSQRFALHSWHLFPSRDVVTARMISHQLPWPPWPWTTQPWRWPLPWPWLRPWPWQWHQLSWPDEGWLLATKHWRVRFLVHFGDYELINTSSRQAKVGTLQNQYCSFIQSSQWNLNWSIQDSRFTQYALFGSLSLLKNMFYASVLHVLCLVHSLSHGVPADGCHVVSLRKTGGRKQHRKRRRA